MCNMIACYVAFGEPLHAVPNSCHSQQREPLLGAEAVWHFKQGSSKFYLDCYHLATIQACSHRLQPRDRGHMLPAGELERRLPFYVKWQRRGRCSLAYGVLVPLQAGHQWRCRRLTIPAPHPHLLSALLGGVLLTSLDNR